MDPNQVTQVFGRCAGCGTVVSPTDVACPRCGRQLDVLVEQTVVMPRLDPVRPAVALETAITTPVVDEPVIYTLPSGSVAAPPVRPRRRRGSLGLVLVLLALLLGGLVLLTTRGTDGGLARPAPPVGQSAAPAPGQPPAPAAVSAWTVANTGGEGVFLRRTPKLDDKLVAWPDNTRLDDLGEEAQGDGQSWRKVRDPRGNVGYVPTRYLAPAARP